MKKPTIIKIMIALVLICIDLPIGVDIFPNFIGYILLIFAATDLMRRQKDMWWLRCAMLVFSVLSFVFWIWQPKFALINIPVGLIFAAGLFMFMRAVAQICETQFEGRVANLDKLALAMLVASVIVVVGSQLMGALYFAWVAIINMIILLLMLIRLYTAYSIVNIDK